MEIKLITYSDINGITTKGVPIATIAAEVLPPGATLIREVVADAPANKKDPAPQEFLKHCFDGTNPALQIIFTTIRGAIVTNIVALGWYNDLIAGSIPGLFVVPDPPESGGWHLALVQLANSVGMSNADRALINTALIEYGLIPVL